MDERTAGSLLAMAEEASAGATGPDAKASLERLEARHGDLLAAIAWFVDAGRTDEALRLVSSLYRFWIVKQRFDEGAVWFERVLASPGGDDRLRGKMAWPPDERPQYERMLAALPAAMGPDGFEGARARGRSMSATAAVEYALG